MSKAFAMGAVSVMLASCGFSAAPGITTDGGPTVGPSIVGFAAATSLEDESSGTVSIPVTLSAPASNSISVGYTITDGSATRDLDYTATNGTLTFSPGEVDATVTLTIKVDALEEQDETIQIALHSVTGGGQLGGGAHTVTISSDILPRVSFALTTSNAQENVQTAFTATLDMPSTKEVRVAYTLAGTATSADYGLAAGTIVFAPGNASQQIMLSPVDDALDEDPETVRVTLVNSVNAVILTSAATRTHTLDDNDPLPVVAFTASSSTVAENVTLTTLTVTLTPVSGRQVTVPFSTAQGATAGIADFAYQSTAALVFPAGTTSRTITVVIVDDDMDEDNETFTTTLGTPTNATLGTSSHVVTITDNDDPPSVSFDGDESDGSALEGDNGTTTHDYRLVLSAPSGRQISVPFTVTGNANSSDFTVTASPIAFNPGQTARTVRITVNGDTDKEANTETVILTLSSNGLSNATQGSPNQRTHTIIDDD